MNIPNPELQLAHNFVVHTNRNIFLTGKAGTGKTTFLHQLKTSTAKRMIVTAPTGVAAINAGGVTLHSFFQMPFGPFVPGSEAYERDSQRKFNKQKIKIIKSLDLLIIDEISMVRADLLDGVDAVLRRYRRSTQPFGGVQLLMIGDLHQLPPVVKKADWNILQPYYDSAFFFSSNSLQEAELVSIELQHIYRQSDSQFIKLLNRVRDNKLDQLTLQELNKRHLPEFNPTEHEGYITLSTHNSKVDTINASKLRALPNKSHRFRATVDGEFPEYSFPTSATLDLKVGAQVMFVRNDSSHEKLFFNGKIGEVTRISSNSIQVQCPEDAKEIVVEKTTWDNIKYSIDLKNKEIIENKIGEFVQYPLKLAWAITIHKSQGLTFERAIIDANAAFAHGQVYVALSRCKTFEGMVLSSPVTAQSVKTDRTVSRFTNNASQSPATQQELEEATINYQQQLLLECFNFDSLRFRINRLVRTVLQNTSLLQVTGVNNLEEMKEKWVDDIIVVGENFRRQLQILFAENNPPETDPAVIDRTTKASVYFQEKINNLLRSFLENANFSSDNKEILKNSKTALNQLAEETAVKLAAVKSCQTGFMSTNYLRAISSAEIDFKPKKEKKIPSPEYSASDVGHPELFKALKDWRSKKAIEFELPHYRILHQKTLIAIAVTLPSDLTSLKQIKGIGDRTAEKYGNELVTLVSEHRK